MLWRYINLGMWRGVLYDLQIFELKNGWDVVKVGNMQMEDKFGWESELKDDFSFLHGEFKDHVGYLRGEGQQAFKLLKHWRDSRAADIELGVISL